MISSTVFIGFNVACSHKISHFKIQIYYKLIEPCPVLILTEFCGKRGQIFLYIQKKTARNKTNCCCSIEVDSHSTCASLTNYYVIEHENRIFYFRQRNAIEDMLKWILWTVQARTSICVHFAA